MTAFETFAPQIAQLEAQKHQANIATALRQLNTYHEDQLKLELEARRQYALQLINN